MDDPRCAFRRRPALPPFLSRPFGLRQEVEEGLLLLEHAVRMRLKNRIIVDTLTADGAVDVDGWRKEARRVLTRLAGESELSQRRMERKILTARNLDGEGEDEHDYRADDVRNLRRRRRVHRSLARRLREWGRSAERVEALLDGSKRAAWEEIDSEIRQLAATAPAVPADEDLLRHRLDLLVSIDLVALAQARADGAADDFTSSRPPAHEGRATPSALRPGSRTGPRGHESGE